MEDMLTKIDTDLHTVSINFEHTESEIQKLNEKIIDLETYITENKYSDKIEMLEKQLENINKGGEVNH